MPQAQHINDPKYWHDRAEEMRVAAEDMKDLEARTTMLDVAAQYERLAERATARATGIATSQ